MVRFNIMKIVVAYCCENYGIASKGSIPWNLSEDLRLFKAITSGHTVVMGRKTWESIGCKPLPYRRNIVLTRSKLSGVETISELSQAPSDSVLIGGGQVYSEALKLGLVDLILATIVKAYYNCDVFFPEELFWGGIWKRTNILENDLFNLVLFNKKRI